MAGFAEGCKETSELPVLPPVCKMCWEIGVCPDWCWSWCSRCHFCAAGCPTYSTALPGHSQPAAKLVFAEQHGAGLGSGASESCTVLGARIWLPVGFCGLWQMMPLRRQTPGAVATPLLGDQVLAVAAGYLANRGSVSATVHQEVHLHILDLKVWKGPRNSDVSM